MLRLYLRFYLALLASLALLDWPPR